jgi:16S rRNA (guanine527-N7)-methyltransferase
VKIREKLARRAWKAGLSLPNPVIDALEAYFELLRKWNRRVSLTSLPVEEGGDEAIDRLLVEPVLATKYLTNPDSAVLDIGSGGGSPAIPMKAAVPRMSLRMVESKTRKAAFLREVVRSLNIDAIVEPVRFEELLAKQTLRDAMDVVTMRAVRVDRGTMLQLQSFIKPGGFLFLFGTIGPMPAVPHIPELATVANHVLLSQWGSRLQILRKSLE